MPKQPTKVDTIGYMWAVMVKCMVLSPQDWHIVEYRNRPAIFFTREKARAARTCMALGTNTGTIRYKVQKIYVSTITGE